MHLMILLLQPFQLIVRVQFAFVKPIEFEETMHAEYV